jgi:hypothetical protein
LVRLWLGLATIGDGKETAVRETCAAGGGMSDEDHAWLQCFADGVE